MSDTKGQCDGVQASRDPGSRRPRRRTAAPRRRSARGGARCATTALRGSRRRLGAWCRCSTRMTRRWLMRSQSPYVAEIAAIAATLGFSGIWFLNGSYQWGCTARARDDDAPWLVRTLDWPFPGLGRHVEVARMAGAAGRVLQRDLAGLCRRADRDGAGPLRGRRSTRRRCGGERGIPGCGRSTCGECRSRPGRCGTCRRIRCCARCSRPRRTFASARRCWRRRRSRGR